jgi:hypothetical protein
MRKILILTAIFCLITIVRIVAQEKYYIPVDIGQEVDTIYATEEKPDDAEVKDIFQKDSAALSKKYIKKIEELRDDWMKLKGKEYKKKFDSDKQFKKDDASPVSVIVHEFSQSTVKIYIVFVYGHSMWHHYYVLLKNLVINRNEYIDDVFDLKEMEEQYSYVFKKIGYGSTTSEMYKKFGKNYVEYEGQSPDFRDIYYEKYNIEVVIQDQKIKYLKKGKPGWVTSETEK